MLYNGQSYHWELGLRRELFSRISIFTLYTTDPTAQKFSDDSAEVGCITGREESEYDSAVDNFVTRRNLYKTIGGGLKEDHKWSL